MLCGLGFVDPVPTPDELLLYYADFYAEHNNHSPYTTPYAELRSGLMRTYRSFAQMIMKDINGVNIRSILDIGCSYGYFLDVFRDEFGADILWGVDMNKDCIREIERKGYHGIRGAFEEISLPEGMFDVIFLGNCFEHFRDPRSAIQKMKGALRDGGRIILTTVNFSSILARVFGAAWRLMTPPGHIYFWTPKSLQKIFDQYGCECSLRPYVIWASKKYVDQRFHDQFGFHIPLMSFYPLPYIPVPSIDVLMGIVKVSI